MKRTLILSVFAAVLGSTTVSAYDVDPPNFFYVGAAAGQSSDFFTHRPTGDSTGFKVMFGLRPLAYVGPELEYVDFGRGNFSTPSGPRAGRVHSTAEGLFAVGYLPIGESPVDLFAKLGTEHLHTIVSDNPFCTFGESLPPVSFAFGGGAQVRMHAFALRAEYERTLGSCGNPTLLSLGLTWMF